MLAMTAGSWAGAGAALATNELAAVDPVVSMGAGAAAALRPAPSMGWMDDVGAGVGIEREVEAEVEAAALFATGVIALELTVAAACVLEDGSGRSKSKPG